MLRYTRSVTGRGGPFRNPTETVMRNSMADLARRRQLTRQQLVCTWTYNVFQRIVGTWGTSLFVFSEGALACNSIWTNAATSLYAGYFPDGSLPAGGRLKNVRWRRGEEKQWGRLCSTGETRREKLDVPLEAETSIGFNFFSSVFKHARSRRPFIFPLSVCLREWRWRREKKR